MTTALADEKTVHSDKVGFIGDTLRTFLNGLNDFHLGFSFKEGGKMSNLDALHAQLEESLQYLHPDDGLTNLLCGLLTKNYFNIADQLDSLENFLTGADGDDLMNREDQLLYTANLWGGVDEEPVQENEEDPKASAFHKERLADFVLAYLLNKIAMDRVNDQDASHPQNFRHILSYFSEKEPEFLLIFETMTTILLVRDKFAIQEKGRASRTLINNFKVEEMLIHISSDRRILPEDKGFIFSWLIAYQKLFRKVLEVLYDKKTVKGKIVQMWFGEDADKATLLGDEKTTDYNLPGRLRMFMDCVLKKDVAGRRDIGRRIVLTVNNEDTLRIMCGLIHEDCDILGNPAWLNKIYKSIYEIICEYRNLCKDLSSAYPRLKKGFSYISRERRISETIISPSHKAEDRTPILGRKSYHELLDETRKNLNESNLIHLFEIWPIPRISQELFNQICLLKHMIPQGANFLIHHYLYREKVLEFLMQLDRVGLKVVKHDYLPLLTNAYQINSMGLFKEGFYMASTGHWKAPIQRPPSMLCCTNPHSVGNCRGHMLRHIVMRVFLGTGEFYESPFVLDSTLRYGQMDEDGGIDALIMRPGLFMIDIPARIIDHWRKVQHQQMRGKLGHIVADKIRAENTMK